MQTSNKLLSSRAGRGRSADVPLLRALRGGTGYRGRCQAGTLNIGREVLWRGPTMLQGFDRLQEIEFNRKSFRKLAHDRADTSPNGKPHSHLGLNVGRDRDAGGRHVDHETVERRAVAEDQGGMRIFRYDAPLRASVDNRCVLLVLLQPGE